MRIDDDLTICPECNNYRDTPNHELGCPIGRAERDQQEQRAHMKYTGPHMLYDEIIVDAAAPTKGELQARALAIGARYFGRYARVIANRLTWPTPRSGMVTARFRVWVKRENGVL